MTDYVDQSLPLRRIALFSSGVAFFEHRGELDGDARLTLPFAADDVSDALKSLMVLDPGCVAPLVSYPAENTTAALASLTPDLTGEPGLAALLSALRGAQVEVTCAGETITGRIVSTEERDGGDGAPERYLSVLTNGTVQVLALGSVRAYRFIDDAVTADLERALELLFSGNTASLRHLVVELPSDSRRHREASLCYVVAAPVWKASYRLDLHGDPFLQGWAIIDNASDTDWDGVELSLMAGRPSSFVQRLYEPYYVARREVPLAIAASAEARTYGAGVAWSVAESVEDMPLSPALPGRMRALAQPAPAMADMAVRTPEATAVGEQFAFTLREPLRLERRRSAMVPLVTGAVEARKVSVFTPDGLAPGTPRSPALGVELTNRLGPLPAGPVSVVDDG
ncbi:MAG: DUF4139 domain-containing protein, partial [Micrococcales bacterium]|nr:DUF4139 domain-containing protein [Micrococcales bacterium]